MNELLKILEWIILVNRAITQPLLRQKTGVNIVSQGKDFGEVVTTADIGVSETLLHGGIAGVRGLCSLLPGCFSEEQDSAGRLTSTRIYQVDPVDGTGDIFDTCRSSSPVSPTTLVSLLMRESTQNDFRPIGGIIFNVLHEYAIVAHGTEIGLCQANAQGKLVAVPYKLTPYDWTEGDPASLGRRISYPQLVFDGAFMQTLGETLSVQQVLCGGAGDQALRFLRNYIVPVGNGCPAFSNLQPLSAVFTAQPDWKCWDTDPTLAIVQAICSNLVIEVQEGNLFGEKLLANAGRPCLIHMHHKQGFALGPKHLVRLLTKAAKNFATRNPDCSLLEKNYGYKDAILAMAK